MDVLGGEQLTGLIPFKETEPLNDLFDEFGYGTKNFV
jgi:hypothetical protein